jgi:hypothetical protein
MSYLKDIAQSCQSKSGLCPNLNRNPDLNPGFRRLRDWLEPGASQFLIGGARSTVPQEHLKIAGVEASRRQVPKGRLKNLRPSALSDCAEFISQKSAAYLTSSNRKPPDGFAQRLSL